MVCPETPRHYIPCTIAHTVGELSWPNAGQSNVSAPVEHGVGISSASVTGLTEALLVVLTVLTAVLLLYALGGRVAATLSYEEVFVPHPLRVSRERERPVYFYNSVKLRLRRVYETILESARRRGLKVSEANTLAEILRSMGILNRVRDIVKAYNTAMYGKCTSCDKLVEKVEALIDEIEAYHN